MEGRRLPLHRMRVSDAERDRTVDHLAVAFVEGRLDLDEYDRRVGLALSSVLLGELWSLTADLPRIGDGVPNPRPAPDREHRSAGELSLPVSAHRWGDEWRWWTGVAVILTGVWAAVSLMVGELVPYWPLVPLGIWGAVLLAATIWPSGEGPLGSR
ncbi:hypothetical protein BJF83_05705 [Nocardiopsis sp. CNR-923]|uniref:DUF1707 SHOCT-like domain-containing protein n=1 Tax=Nocardiopsis sp. CNR-923 TaxID=1904965 RepID=UPI00095E8844|nr:DUF1707 domain-containing protein [Nocardiopsis sp. CNR-923]OLT24977.1 hypothetical protein BJF83_05705 [Nocardiopsis sp. CNR-923]